MRAALRVLAHVADDVGELKGQAQVLRVDARAEITIAEDLDANKPDRRRDPVTVQAQLVEAAIALARQIHLNAVDDLIEIVPRDGKAANAIGQRARDRARGDTAINPLQLLAPARQQGRRFAHLLIVGDIIDEAAESVGRIKRAAALVGQQLEGVIKVRRRFSGDTRAAREVRRQARLEVRQRSHLIHPLRHRPCLLMHASPAAHSPAC